MLSRFDALLDVLVAVRRLAEHDAPLRAALERLTGESPSAAASASPHTSPPSPAEARASATPAAPARDLRFTGAALPAPASARPAESPVDVTGDILARIQGALSGASAPPPVAPYDAYAETRTRLDTLARDFALRRALARAHQSGAHADVQTAAAALARTASSAPDQRFWAVTLGEPAHAAAAKRLDLLCDVTEQAARSLAAALGSPPEALRIPLELAAEAQATVRAALMPFKIQDGAQQRFLSLLVPLCAAEQVHSRFLTRESVAPPVSMNTIRGLGARLVAGQPAAAPRAPAPSPADAWPKAAQRHYKTLLYHVQRASGAGDPSEHDLTRIAECLEIVAAAGVPPGNRVVREIFEDHLELLALVDGDAAERILEAIESWIRQTSETEMEDADAATADAWAHDADVREARRLLGGRSVVVIGGEAREAHVQRLREALAVDVEWVSSRVHESPTVFHAAVQREGVGAVCLLIRWASHSFEDVQDVARAAGAAWVRVPGGYNPVQIARCLRAQASRHLARTAAGA